MKKTILTIFLIFSVLKGFSQNFIDDRTMKLDGISIDKNYGYSQKLKKTIKVGSIENEYKYINALIGPNGEQISAQRLGSCCEFKCKTAGLGSGFLDQWQITYKGLEKPIILYINGYEYENPMCPIGLGYKTK